MLWNSRHLRISGSSLPGNKPIPRILGITFAHLSVKIQTIIFRLMRYTFLVPLLLLAYSLHSQIAAHVSYSADRDEMQTIRVQWSAGDESQWRIDNKDRLEVIGLRSDILSEALPKSSTNKTIYNFDLQRSGEVELLIEIFEIKSGEKLILRDQQGRTLFAVSSGEKKRVLTPSFDPAIVSLEWWSTEDGVYESDFRISNFYLHDDPIERGGRSIGFGTAWPCHPNASCKPDSILQLISNSAVRIRMVMEEGIGWCTGSFINNTRNDKTPYILTAYHCTFEYTPKYDLWRFDLEYRSDSCQNPLTEPQFISLTGCEKKAGGQASDFLLVLLDETLPANQNITFAGWNRDDIATPDTSFLVHHPNADIRKFSTSTNKAVIHPNQIGWSEGYTTPANHHFRFKFTEGGHQPGSSGGCVFDQDGLLVAQLHGGSSGCEDDNNAYAGRLSRSWELGTSDAERLKDWLDPDNTNALSIPSITNLESGDITDVTGTIHDPKGRAIKNVVVIVSGGVQDTLSVNDEGQFQLKGINRNLSYQITPEKNDNPVNGLNAFDLVAIQKHLLGKDTFDFQWQQIAADATNNIEISVGDIVVLLRLLLGKISFLPSSSSWRFDPPVITLDTIPAGEIPHLQITGIKIGDVDSTADPTQ